VTELVVVESSKVFLDGLASKQIPQNGDIYLLNLFLSRKCQEEDPFQGFKRFVRFLTRRSF
jgi:hypothetical protein